MRITVENKMHFFVRDESSDGFTDIRIESFMAIPQRNNETKFRRIEDIRLFYHVDIENYEVGSFTIDFGRNDCCYSGHKSEKELYAYMQSDISICNFKSASKEDYLLMREKALKKFLEHRCADFSKLEIGCVFPR
ncbi:hypothetical protein AB9T89_10325 [Flavobacterium oncorhynchi]|uniref:hypothetical protein n=1 Tax=Flavobacterium oncorhynchi TaxID=728056 RepID=UPI003519F008